MILYAGATEPLASSGDPGGANGARDWKKRRKSSTRSLNASLLRRISIASVCCRLVSCSLRVNIFFLRSFQSWSADSSCFSAPSGSEMPTACSTVTVLRSGSNMLSVRSSRRRMSRMHVMMSYSAFFFCTFSASRCSSDRSSASPSWSASDSSTSPSTLRSRIRLASSMNAYRSDIELTTFSCKYCVKRLVHLEAHVESAVRSGLAFTLTQPTLATLGRLCTSVASALYFAICSSNLDSGGSSRPPDGSVCPSASRNWRSVAGRSSVHR
mmetsp:Transcript_6089/g.18839  ORF Transcript_6089/g.18839 Transcript_6089/m.18839 type:complete len:269 (+) Transcript_6089:1961-2767(+)